MASLGRNPSLSLATQYSSIHSAMLAVLQDFHHTNIISLSIETGTGMVTKLEFQV